MKVTTTILFLLMLIIVLIAMLPPEFNALWKISVESLFIYSYLDVLKWLISDIVQERLNHRGM